MKNSLKIVLAAISFGMMSMTAFAFTGSGAGTVGDPYQIVTCTHLQEMVNGLTSYYILMGNVDCSATTGWNGGLGFSPVGDSVTAFTGTFDGQGYTISNLFINLQYIDYVGLFGVIDGATITNVTLENLDISGSILTGGLVGACNYTATPNVLTDVHTTGTISGTTRVGGLVGGCSYSTISDSHSAATVSGSSTDVGGLVGKTYYDTINTSYATGAVSGAGRIGGLVGTNEVSSVIQNSYATGSVTLDNAGDSGGGLVGYLTLGSSVINSYSTGAVLPSVGGTNTGGLIGSNVANGGPTTVTASYWDTETSTQASSAGGTGFTTALMKTLSTFSAWNFDTIWDIDLTGTNNSGYPFLSWQTFGGGGGVPEFSTWMMLATLAGSMALIYKRGRELEIERI